MFRRVVLSAGAWSCVAVAASLAQTPVSSPIFSSGTPVGKPLLRSVGTPLPAAAPQVGRKIGTAPGGQPTQSATPPGFQFDLKNVVAPVNPEFLPPALRPQQNQSLYDAAFKKWAEAFGLTKPPELKSNFTPGMSRRNREKLHERQWWRD